MPFFGNLGTVEWVIIGVLVILFFGNKKLKELARGLGESGRELKKVRKEFRNAKEEINRDLSDEDENQKENVKIKKPETKKADNK